MGIRIKSYHPSGIRVFVQDTILYERLEEQLRSVYHLKRRETFDLFYRDEEQEWIRFSSDRELNEAIQSLPSGEYLRIKVQPSHATFPLVEDPLAQEQVLAMARTLFAQPGSFPRLVQTLLPSVVEHLQTSGQAPEFVVPSTRQEHQFDRPLFAEEREKKESRDAKAMLESFRSQMGSLDLVCRDPALLRSYIEPPPVPVEEPSESQVLRSSRDSFSSQMDEDSFVIIEQPEQVESRSMSDVFVSFGFTDRQRNEEVIRQCNGSFEQSLDMLISLTNS